MEPGFDLTAFIALRISSYLKIIDNINLCFNDNFYNL